MNPSIDPTMPHVEVTIGGKTYNLVFTFAACAVAEQKLRKLGHQVNILRCLDFNNLDCSSIAPLLYAALMTENTDISYEDVVVAITFKTFPAILNALSEAWIASISEPKDGDDAPLAKPE